MVNMSSQNLVDTTIRVLRKGFNFTIALRRIPVEDNTICGVEAVICHLPVVTPEAIRKDT